ncbi:MAG: tyrosine--tRNA ligase [Planctomycetes bacterium]|nr:tyrosine--tRNA ligase [Planctomycetota bacterium]
MLDIAKQLETIKRGAVEIHSEEELIRKLKANRPLRIKLGVDPTAPDIHLGHTVVLQKLRQFQELGHQAVLIIGDFTALIGDPSGREKTRPQLSAEEIERNAQTYLAQVGKVLDNKRLEIVHNGDWLAKLTMENIIRLAAQVTVARFIEREDFRNRLKAGTPIGLHEFLYPLLQGQDSVAVRADVELGGTDQIFNLLVGRDLQRSADMTPQVVLTMPLLVGLDGEQKMSKSYGNHIGLNEPASEMYGKAMSLADKLMETYFTLLTSIPAKEVKELLNGHPKEAKVRLAKEIVTQYHGQAEADKSAERFESVFSRKESPDEMAQLKVDTSMFKDGKVYLPKLINLSGAVKSSSEAKRLITQGGVTIDGQKITDPDAEISVKTGQVLKIGKKNRFYRIEI